MTTAIDEALGRWVPALAATGTLGSVVLFGSAAREDWGPKRSDLNLACVLRSRDPSALTALAPTLTAAWRQDRVAPWLVQKDEIATLSDVYALKLLDIRDHHRVLHGPDPFAGVTIDRAAVRLRAEQELRNHQIRLRRALCLSAPSDISTHLGPIRKAARVLLRGLLFLERVERPRWDRDTVMEVSAANLGVGPAFWRGPDGVAVLATLDALVDRADRVVP